MKIAIIGHKRIPSRIGGIEIVVNELAVRMAQAGHDVYVYNRNCGEEKLSEYENIHIIEIPTSKKSSLNAIIYSFLAALHIIFHKYDVVHFHAEGPCSMIPLVKLFGKRTVATIHGLDWQRAKWGGFATKYLKFGEKMAAKYSDELITLAPSMRKYFLDTYGRESSVVPNGIAPIKKTEPNIIKKYGIEKRDYILFLARITPEKGLDYLFEAFKKLDTDKKLIVAGGLEPSTPYIEEIKKKAAEDERIKLVGFVQGDEFAELFSNCYLYVLPSDIEGMPISLLEAVSCRARVLVSDIPENTDMLVGYGHSFGKSDPESLFEKLSELVSNEAIYDCDFKADKTPDDVEKQLDELISMYNWDEVTEKTIEIYKKAGK